MTPTILLVEDNPITSKLVRFTLEKEGYAVVDAALGATAVQHFVAATPALVLLDLLLPDIDGFDLFRRLRELARGSEVPILAFTGLLSPHEEARLSDLGFDDVVSKPVEPSRLVQIVKGYIAPSDTPIPVPGAASHTVIVADDDAVQRKLVGLRLQRAGFRVIPAADGQDALERARAEHPYAIVSDVLMPRMDGFGLCMAVRADPELATTPVFLISNSYLDNDDRSLAHRAGADELLLRTTELRDVIELLRKNPSTQRRAEVASVVTDPLIERERVGRMMNQLDRQVAMQAKLTQRCSLLGAELAVLTPLREAPRNVDEISQPGSFRSVA